MSGIIHYLVIILQELSYELKKNTKNIRINVRRVYQEKQDKARLEAPQMLSYGKNEMNG